MGSSFPIFEILFITFFFLLIIGINQYLAISIHVQHKIYFYEYTGFSIILILADYLFNIGIIIISLSSTNGSEYCITKNILDGNKVSDSNYNPATEIVFRIKACRLI